ncbi:hypothetical protein, partial [Mesorhizobium sp. M1C.F.Ca.ET.212.01.1.1]|uniref:hypothetical protein n=1 Tax=Mesorhizobium sp. M1C.F.Ca.ET.212.01.1.1 TaxID=2500527 RepID=UPI001AED8CF4
EYLSNPDAVQKWRESARHFLERAASSGSQDALLSLASAYKAGVIVEHDPVKQLAYALAAQKSSPIPGYQEAYQELRSSLTPLEIKRSEVLANVIYDKCCKEN